MHHSMEELIQYIQRETTRRQLMQRESDRLNPGSQNAGSDVSMLIEICEHLTRIKNQKTASL